jgi:hypothetical protein
MSYVDQKMLGFCCSIGKENNGSAGSFNIGNLILQLKQHIAGGSFLNLNALQCVQILSTAPITMAGCKLYSISELY